MIEDKKITAIKEYAEKKRAAAHAEIFKDICMVINNCTSCFNKAQEQADCCPSSLIPLHKVTENQFCMKTFDSKTNRELLALASKHNYKSGIVIEDGNTWIKFWKQFKYMALGIYLLKNLYKLQLVYRVSA